MGDLDISLIHACERNGWSKSFRLSDRTSAARIGHASEFRSVDTVELPHLAGELVTATVPDYYGSTSGRSNCLACFWLMGDCKFVDFEMFLQFS